MTEVVEELHQVLMEAPKLPLGMLVSYKTPQGKESYGVVIDSDEKGHWVVSAYDPALEKDMGRRAYRADPIMVKMRKVLRRFKKMRLDIHVVPANRAKPLGRMRGQDMRLYRGLQNELHKARIRT